MKPHVVHHAVTDAAPTIGSCPACCQTGVGVYWGEAEGPNCMRCSAAGWSAGFTPTKPAALSQGN